ncbi:MAG: glycosyltransferase [Clostridia bacterium]|nr:glycosyltransferase [Clostridia bacterium]
MKKKVLIVSSSLSTGGLEKCLINLCDSFDYNKYEVDLYLFNEGRALLEKLNKNVNLLPDSPYYADVYNCSFGKSIKILIKKKKFGLALYRIWRFLRNRFGVKKFSLHDWKQMKKTMLKIDTHYDVAIGFEEESADYYVADCVDATVKIGWIHTDIKKINTNKTLDKFAFDKLNYVVTVSNNSLNSLIEEYPLFKEKFKHIAIPRLLNYKEIDNLSKEPNLMQKSEINLLSVGRLVELKGFHLCVPVCKRLIDEGFNVKWYVAGEGPFRTEIEKEIENLDIKESFVLLGNCDNPYSLIKSADICVQPSSYEGQSVAVFEQKYFGKPVVVSNIPSNLEMIENYVNGIVVDRTVDDIYRGVKELVCNDELRERLAKERVLGQSDNSQIMQAIEDLF